MEQSNCSPCIFIVWIGGWGSAVVQNTLSDADVNLVQFSEMLYLCMEEEEWDWRGVENTVGTLSLHNCT